MDKQSKTKKGTVRHMSVNVSDDEVSPLLNKVYTTLENKPKKVFPNYTENGSLGERIKSRTPYHVDVRKVALSRVASADDLKNVMQYNRYLYYTKLRSQPGGNALSGFALGIGIIVIMSFICCFTCLLIVDSAKVMPEGMSIEFIDVCAKLLGRGGKLAAFLFGFVAIFGAVVVYWVLMTNFMYKIGKFVHEETSTSIHLNTSQHHLYHGVYCLHKETELNHTVSPVINLSLTNFYKYWDQSKTVPFYLLVVLLPLSSLKSPTFFTKFNAFGTLSVFYVMCFVLVKSIQWGPNLHFHQATLTEPVTHLYRFGFPAFTGILSLGFYIHNAILSVLATNENPENNKRDVTIAYLLTAGTYFFVAVVFYSGFPIDKGCIEQVLLDNFSSKDIMTVVAQCGLLFQMTTVFPLLMYILRVQMLGYVLGRVNLGYPIITLFNCGIISVAVLTAVFYPEVGHIIRYVGSVSGLVFIFTLPSLVQLVINSKEGKLTYLSIMFYSFLILLGVLNFIAQFLISDN